MCPTLFVLPPQQQQHAAAPPPPWPKRCWPCCQWTCAWPPPTCRQLRALPGPRSSSCSCPGQSCFHLAVSFNLQSAFFQKQNREWVTRSIPLLIFLGLVLYVDRIVRREVILDSSALVATVFVAHVLNVCRSSIAHVDSGDLTLQPAYWNSFPSNNNHDHPMHIMQAQAALIAVVNSNNNGTAVSHHQQQQQPFFSGWQESLIYAAYTLASIMLLMDVDVMGMVLPSSPPFQQQKRRRPASPPSLLQLACWHQEPFFHSSDSSVAVTVMQPVPVRISTVVMHCVLVGAVLQMRVYGPVFMTPARIMARSFSFTCLSICWTYVSGTFFV